MFNNITTIAFDADDTLWENEPFFLAAENQFCALLEDFLPQHSIVQELYKTEIKNLPLYGYGIKGFVLSMIETAINITNNNMSTNIITKILDIGHSMMQQPIQLINGVSETLISLTHKYRLIVATKGDLIDQERKLISSGLGIFFHHIEIMSEKNIANYQKLLKHLDCQPENFLMIGNSIKSDIIPVLELGDNAVHIPFYLTWAHEQTTQPIIHDNFIALKSIYELNNFLS